MTGAVTPVPGSASIVAPTYWWYRARSDLLAAVFLKAIPPGALLLDVGSADGPSVDWVPPETRRVDVDVDANGLRPGGVCGSALELPFAAMTFDVVSAYDVVEHFPDEGAILNELGRVLLPGGRLLVSVPAYQWAWTGFDVGSGHYRRYTRGRLMTALARAGFSVDRATYAFATTLPAFAADRLRRRLAGGGRPVADLAPVPSWLERVLLAVTKGESRVLQHRDLPFGSSVFTVARRPLSTFDSSWPSLSG